jgi:hypothetical protein
MNKVLTSLDKSFQATAQHVDGATRGSGLGIAGQHANPEDTKFIISLSLSPILFLETTNSQSFFQIFQMGIISSQSLAPTALTPMDFPAIFQTTACSICHDCTLGESGPSSRTTPCSVGEYQSSSRAGCAGCGMVLDAVEAFEPGWAREHAADGSIQLGLNYDVLSIYLLLKDAARCERFEVFQSHGT